MAKFCNSFSKYILDFSIIICYFGKCHDFFFITFPCFEDKKDDFLNTLFAGIPDDKRCVFSNVAFFEKVIELEDRENVWPNPEELKDDSGMSLLQFVHEKIPDVQITSEKVSDVKIDEFEELNKKMEEMAQEMLEKDKKWKEERRKFEEQRAEAARQIEQLKKGRKKRKWYKL